MGVDDTESTRTGKITNQQRDVHRKASATDLEKALQQSERLLNEVDGGRRRIALVQAVSSALIAVVVLALALPEAGSHDPIPVWAAIVGALAAALIIAALSQRLITLLRKQVSRDELIMIDLVNMQRQLLPLLARDEDWSSVQSILAQKRLERFPIEPVPTFRQGRMYRSR